MIWPQIDWHVIWLLQLKVHLLEKQTWWESPGQSDKRIKSAFWVDSYHLTFCSCSHPPDTSVFVFTPELIQLCCSACTSSEAPPTFTDNADIKIIIKCSYVSVKQPTETDLNRFNNTYRIMSEPPQCFLSEGGGEEMMEAGPHWLMYKKQLY